MADFRLDVECRRTRDEGQPALKLDHRPERILGAVNEERGCAEPGEVGGPSVFRSSRRMERVGEEKECWSDGGILGGQETGLASSVGVPAEADPWDARPGERSHRGAKPRAVPPGPTGRRRAATASLPERQITAEHGYAAACERVGERDEEWAVRGRACPVSEDEPARRVPGRGMEGAVDGWLVARRLVKGHRRRPGQTGYAHRELRRPDPSARASGSRRTRWGQSSSSTSRALSSGCATESGLSTREWPRASTSRPIPP